MDQWAAFEERANRQHRVVATWQAAELGIGTTALWRRVKEAGWIKLRRGAVLVGTDVVTPEAELMAVELVIRDPVVLAGWSAAYVWELVKTLRRPIGVAVPEDRDICARGVKVRHFRHFDRLVMVERHGLTVPIVEHTICLLAAVASIEELVRAISTADRKRRTTVGQIRSAMVALGSFRGVRKLRAALDRVAAEMTHSGLEALGRSHLHAAGFVPHRRPYTVLDEKGRFIAEVDIPFIPEKIAIEIYGEVHEGQEQADEDRRRRLERAGWIVIVVYERRLREQPHVFIQQVRDAFEQRKLRSFSA